MSALPDIIASAAEKMLTTSFSSVSFSATLLKHFNVDCGTDSRVLQVNESIVIVNVIVKN
jgi:hypothetical protein